MIDHEARAERIAIRMDSHMTEAEAIRQTDAEIKSKVLPESIAKAKALQQKIKEDRASKRVRDDGKSKAAGI